MLLGVQNSVIEDQYIDHLAGLERTSLIGTKERQSASKAQHHPTSNKLFAIINASMISQAVTTVGVMVSPFAFHSLRNTLMGAAICEHCNDNANKLADTAYTILQLVDQNITNEEVKRTFTTNFGEFTSSICKLDNYSFRKCRIINYAGSLVDVVSNHYATILTASLALFILGTIIYKSSYERAELLAKIELERSLQKKYSKIADRLLATQKNRDMTDIASRILARKREIDMEIEDLNVPGFDYDTVQKITNRVFMSAKSWAPKS